MASVPRKDPEEETNDSLGEADYDEESQEDLEQEQEQEQEAEGPHHGYTANDIVVLQEQRLKVAQQHLHDIPGVSEKDAQTLLGLNYLTYGYGAKANKQRAQYSKKAFERQVVHFDAKIRSAEDYKDLSSVYFGEDGFNEAQAELEEAMKEQCYVRIKVVHGVRKRQLVRIYYDAEKMVFSQAKGDDAGFNKKFPWAYY